jgi:transposase-like protein
MAGGEGEVGFASERIFGNISSRDASVAAAGINSQIPTCPKCGDKTQTVWRAGTYQSELGDVVQRWLCRQCGLRFSDPVNVVAAKERIQQEFAFEGKVLKNRGTYLILAKYA